MITEDYVSYETAKLLKAKGFENNSPTCNKVFKGHKYEINGEKIDAEDDVTIPTIQMAMKWLRENHKFHFEIIRSEGFYFCHIQNADDGSPIAGVVPFASTYEEAVEDGIQYCLKNLIQ